jgi:hypothetical protein
MTNSAVTLLDTRDATEFETEERVRAPGAAMNLRGLTGVSRFFLSRRQGRNSFDSVFRAARGAGDADTPQTPENTDMTEENDAEDT